jgi:OOP family OmpA-OmpF porin
MLSARSLTVCSIACGLISLLPDFGGARTGENVPGVIENIELHIWLQDEKLSIAGALSSAAHENILRQTAREYFPRAEYDFELDYRTSLPPGWALLSELTMRAIAETRAANAIITTDRLHVRGFTSDLGRWQTASARVQRNLFPGMTYIDNVVEIHSTASFQAQCGALFDRAIQGRRVEFAQGSAQISSSAHALLDELIQISADCPDAYLTITGHADPGGDKAENQRLGEDRARSVINYMINRGIDMQRLRASGTGPGEVLLANNTNDARQLNRHIEFAFAFP